MNEIGFFKKNVYININSVFEKKEEKSLHFNFTAHERSNRFQNVLNLIICDSLNR